MKKLMLAIAMTAVASACALPGPNTTPWTKPAAPGGSFPPTTTNAADPTTEGSLLVPKDIEPGNYWAAPTTSWGGYVAVCSDYTCEVGAGMIKNYIVSGRTMIPIPSNAVMINVQRVNFTPVI
jgi:hypothetical protein